MSHDVAALDERKYRDGLPLPPLRMRNLPVDHRGYPVPWFVQWIDGRPDFRIIDGDKLPRAVRQRLCWVCGQKLGRYLTFVIGPMCAINRTISEPPSHLECATYSARNCPFCAMPKAKRRENNIPDGVKDPAGVGLKRNPGVILCWTTLSYNLMHVDNGVLFRLGDPVHWEWWSEGRPAKRDEVLASIESGLPLLKEMAASEGAASCSALETYIARAQRLLPET